MIRRPTAAALAAIAGLWGATAHADVASITAQIQSGGAAGTGLGGDSEVQNQAFFDRASGITYGAMVGVEFLFIDVWVEHDQYIEPGEFLGTWTQLMIGLDTQFALGGKRGQHWDRETGELVGGRDAGYLELGFAVGAGAGTLQQVDPPLDNAQVDDKGVVGQVHVGVGYNLGNTFSIGLAVPIQVAYLIKSGVANDLDNHYSSAQGALLLNLRARFGLK